MRKVIQGEERFQIKSTEFSASPSREETILMYSSDGVNYTAYAAKKVPAMETTVVNNFTAGMYFYFKNNKTNLEINWED